MGVRNPDRFVRDSGTGGGTGGVTIIEDANGDALVINPDGSINIAGTVPVSDSILQTKVPDEEGVWEYYAGTSGTVTVGTKLGAGERVIGIAAAVTASGGTVQINGGDVIPIPFPGSGQPVVGVDLSPRGNLVDPVIVFSGTASFMVEIVR